MQPINSSISRVGNFTSSEIAAIMTDGKAKDSLGKPALTYIQECNMERRLGRSIDAEVNSRPLTWGHLVEKRVFELLGTEYQLVSSDTITHPAYDFWAGSPDANKFDEGRTVIDIKSPITLKSFCQLVEPLYNAKLSSSDGLVQMQHIRDNHKDGEKYYWQLVSNSILTDSKFAELIVYAPYKNELEAIREMARSMDDEKQYRYFWLNSVADDELPFLIEGGYYKNLNTIRFEVPITDKEALIKRVELCGKDLIKKQTYDKQLQAA
jgi:hypothetical protein